MKTFVILVAAFLATSAGGFSKTEAPRGRARFELLGMLDEYMGRLLDDAERIERFYASEAAAANRFEKVLQEFCAEESLPPVWQRTKETSGAIIFSEPRIAAALNASFSVRAEYGYGLHRAGALSRETISSATRADLLRYVAGAYLRFGDREGFNKKSKLERRAFFAAANNDSKFRVLGDFLSRLGCTKLSYYASTNSVPTGSLLTFSPSAEVRTSAGLGREITPQEIKAINPTYRPDRLLPPP